MSINVRRLRWPDDSDLRVGLGCMRMSTDEQRDEALARATIAAAVDAGVTVFDTARAYGHGESELGHNERLLASALRDCGAERTARIVTKGGMTRPGGAWVPDGRAKAIRADCAGSLDALDGFAIDLYVLHAPDPRTPWRTSVRALSRLVDEGLVRRVGLSNVNRTQLDEALELAPIAAVQVGLSAFDERALRGGVVDRCTELGIAVIAHSPLGGPRRAAGIGRLEMIAAAAAAHDVSPAEAALAWLLQLSPAIVAIPGARRPETARSAASAATLQLEFAGTRPAPAAQHRARRDREVVLVMGIPGAGKTRIAEDYVARGYVRLNRDERGGSLRDLAGELDEQLGSGVRRLVLDSTYLSRAARSYVIEAAARHDAAARCVWLDTPLVQAQVNLVERLLERFGSLPAPDEMRALSRREPGLLMPTSQMRAARELEPPSLEEGWTDVEQLPFTRAPSQQPGRPAVFVAAAAVTEQALAEADPTAPHLVFDWNPEGDGTLIDSATALAREAISGPVEAALCSHGAGPPTCWCRPPLPGLPLAFARVHGVDTSKSFVIGTGPAHRTLATTLGARYTGP